MARQARIVIPGIPHHVTQRGNNQQDVFLVDGDRQAYLRILKEQAEKYGLEVIGYCLMINHVHLVVVPETEESLALALGRTHYHYAQYINALHARSGHLWQGRFCSCAMEDAHAVAALRYVERNPVAAGLVSRAWDYEWSSAAAHVGRKDRTGLLDLDAWRERWPAEDWRKLLQSPDDERSISALEHSTACGWPLGTDSFLSKLEKTMGCRVRPMKVGRPKKS
jgi:putative transposase